MKHKLLKLNAVFLLGIGLTPLQGQTAMTVKQTGGTQTAYALSAIRKLTFSSTGNMSVTKTTGGTDDYALIGVRYLKFGDTDTGIATSTTAKGNLQLYPNPVADVLYIQLSEAGSRVAIVELISIEGKVLYKGQLSGTGFCHINVSQFRKGVYLCRVNNGTSIETSKFLKR